MASKTPLPLITSSTRKQNATIASITLADKLDLVPAILLILGNVFLTVIGLKGGNKEFRHPKLFYRIMCMAMRAVGGRLSPRQMQFICPPTSSAYNTVCKKRGVKPATEIMEDGETGAHWIGERDGVEKVILYFHEGIFYIPGSLENFEYMFRIVDMMREQGKKGVACLFLAYDLAPESPYPRQIQQAAMLLNHTILNLKIPPSKIIIAGDSAGAQLALALLSHITHPHPNRKIPRITPLSTPLSATALLSPWLTYSTTSPSFTYNLSRDIINPSTLSPHIYLGLNPPKQPSKETQTQITTEERQDRCTNPSTANWERSSEATNEVMISVGGFEVFKEDVEMFAGVLEAVMPGKVCMIRMEGEVHGQIFLDLGTGKREGEMARGVKEWFAGRF